MDLARDGFLDRLARFDEPGERREALGREARLAAKQDLALMLDQHDRDRVNPRIVLGLAIVAGAIALPTAFGEQRRRPATRAKAVPGVPIDQGPRAAIGRQFVRIERRHRRPQARIGRGHAARQVRSDFGKAGLFPGEPKEHQFAVWSGVGQRAPGQLAVGIDHRIKPIEPQQPRPPVHQGLERGGIGADMVSPVEPGPGKGDGAGGHALRACIAVRSAPTAWGNSRRIGSLSCGIYWT